MKKGAELNKVVVFGVTMVQLVAIVTANSNDAAQTCPAIDVVYVFVNVTTTTTPSLPPLLLRFSAY